MIDDKVLERIQKLFSMAEHQSSNQNEAATALEMAQALLLKHNLTRADIKDNGHNATPAGIGVIDGNELSGYTWKRYLLTTLANANLCKVIGTPSQKAWHLFGNYDNVRSVLEMYNWVTPQLDWLAAKEYRAYKNDQGTERAQTWKLGFYMGAIETIRARLEPPIQAFSAGAGYALVTTNTAMVKQAIHKVYPHLTSGSRRSSGGYDGRSAGRQAGANIRLTPQRMIGNTLRLSC